MLFLLYLIIISFYDIRYGKIPNSLTVVFFSGILCADLIFTRSTFLFHLFCSLVFFLLFLFISLTTKGIGMGDVKLAAVTGYCFGILNTSLIIATGCVIGIIFFIGSYLRKQKRKTLPFAPFIAAGFAISEIFFRRII